MSKSNRYTKELRVKIDEKLDAQLTMISKQRGESKSDVARRMLKECTENETTSGNLDFILDAIRNVIRQEIKPVEERMAKINAKNAITSGTSMYLNYFVINEALKNNLPAPAKEIFEDARKKAVAKLKEREE